MPHSIVRIANQVIENKEQFTPCMISRAQYIIDWNTKRRTNINRLWKKYHKEYSAYVKSMYSLNRKQQMNISNSMNKTLFNSDKTRINEFHICKNSLNYKKKFSIVS